MDRLIYLNDRAVDVDSAGINVTSAGLLYGWGVFTTVRVTNGRLFALDRYIERLFQHAERARIPVVDDADSLKQAALGLVRANSVIEGRARLTLLRGDAGGWRASSGRESETLIFTSSDAAAPARDVAITVSPYRLLSSSPLAGIKRTAMTEHLLALEEARARGFTEAIMLNERGEVVSATAGNIFWVQGDELFTPALATGCVAGITRGFVCEIARRIRIHLLEGSFSTQMLLDAKEAFLTSTTRRIAPIVSFDLKRYGDGPGQVTKILTHEFQRLDRDARMEK